MHKRQQIKQCAPWCAFQRPCGWIVATAGHPPKGRAWACGPGPVAKGKTCRSCVGRGGCPWPNRNRICGQTDMPVYRAVNGENPKAHYATRTTFAASRASQTGVASRHPPGSKPGLALLSDSSSRIIGGLDGPKLSGHMVSSTCGSISA